MGPVRIGILTHGEIERMDILLTLCLTAFIAGVVNSVAGGGTLLTFPALGVVFSSLGHSDADAMVFANATSTTALVPGSVAGAWGYRGEVAHTRRWLLLLALPSLVGGVLGSLLVTKLDAKYFAALVPWLLLAAAILFLFDTVVPKKKPDTSSQPGHSVRAMTSLAFFQLLVAIYGGYFGAGMGILMLSSLALMGVGNIHEMNALKSILGSIINGVSVVVFVVEGQVFWRYALPMAVAAIIGGYLGARLALRIRPRYVRWAVIAIGFGLAGYYFFH